MADWKPIRGYEGLYEVSSNGEVRSIDRLVCHGKNHPNDTRILKGRIIKQQLNSGNRSNIKPRWQVGLSKDGKVSQKQVHRLVAETFLENYDSNLEVNHIDGNPLNNKVENLEMVSKTENVNHAFDNGLIQTGMKILKIDPDSKEVIKIYRSEADACRQNGTYQGRVANAIRRNRLLNGFEFQFLQENL